VHGRDLAEGAGWVELPDALGRKYPSAGRLWPWQWVFPARRRHVDRETGQIRRHHLHESAVQRAMAEAVRASGIGKRATCHTLRHHADCRTMPIMVSTSSVLRLPVASSSFFPVVNAA